MASLWEKIKSVIFVEEEVDDDEEEKEAVKPAPVTVKPSQPKPQKPQSVPSPAVTYTEPEVVTLGSKKPQKETVTERLQNQSKPVSAKPSVKEPQVNYQYTQVISPIYGMTGAAKEEKEKTVKPVSLTPAKPVEKSPLGTVLSPINGTVSEPKNEKLPNKVANLSIDDLINDDFMIDNDADEGASLSVTPVKHFGDTENLSLFDEEEQ